MKHSTLRRPAQWLAITAMLAGLTACTSPSSNTPSRVFFIEPHDNAVVSSPVQVRLGSENLSIEPAGEVREGAGHLHILVDTACLAAGQGIPKDDRHIHYGKGQLEAELELSPGEHTLCLQAANGVHIALDGEGMTQTIQVMVESGPTAERHDSASARFTHSNHNEPTANRGNPIDSADDKVTASANN